MTLVIDASMVVAALIDTGAAGSGAESRIWDLRANVTCYDAWYVAGAEALGAPLATLNSRLAHASGPRCPFVTAPAAP